MKRTIREGASLDPITAGESRRRLCKVMEYYTPITLLGHDELAGK
jgi:hypothetical protein